MSRVEQTRAYLALGSNLGDRLAYLRMAVEALRRHPKIRIARTSPIYENPAVTLASEDLQPDFLNAVVEVETSLNARALLEVCQEIEREAGRDREKGKRWQARTLDVDLIAFGDEEIDEPGLRIPHPRLGERLFVLRPLADIAPDARIPAPFSARVTELLEMAPTHEMALPIAETL